MATKKTTARKPSKTATAKMAAKKSTPKKSPAKTASKTKPAGKASTAKKQPASSKAEFHFYDEGLKTFVPVQDATEVKISGFECFRFFVHKAADGKGWTVSEASSGARITFGKTPADAKTKAKVLLDKYGADKLAECARKNVAKHGVAPGMKAPERVKEKFSVTTDDGEKIEVMYDKDFQNHLEFKGKISPTGYHSHFGYDGKGDVKEAARKLANQFRAELLKKQSKQNHKPLVTKTAANSGLDNSTGGKGGKPKGKMSMLDAAEEVLKESKQPLCCKEISQKIFALKLAESGGRTPHATLSAAMGREIKAKGESSRFRRADRGQFSLNI